ncbi:MAG: histidine kinase [Candidatus Marinimicrobia bacterium]|jgi:two-component system, LytTR family, sensor kinase|nr:histidine kinase [FCB group bacterium]MBL7025242.1 histidine kinase [Candidatus Neomarinimicrobiota bacterium]
MKVLLHIVGWLLVLLFYSSVYGRFMGAFAPALLHTLITLPFYLLPTYYLAYFIVPRFLLTQQYLRATIHTIYLILFTAFGYIMTSIAVILMPTPDFFYTSGPNPMSIDLFIHLIGIFAVVFLVAAIRLFQLRQEVEHERLKAETDLLKGQLHPHFLFNTLNNLYAQTLKQSPAAPEMILKLSSLLDYTLYQTRHPYVPLEKELEGIEAYIELEKLRFGERLDLSLEIQGYIDDKTIAPLIFMPLVENAFKHGIARHDHEGWIKISLKVMLDGCKFVVSNSVLETTKTKDKHSQGIGLKNLRRRLQLQYADQYEMKIQAESDTYTVSLTLKNWEPRHVHTLSAG